MLARIIRGVRSPHRAIQVSVEKALLELIFFTNNWKIILGFEGSRLLNSIFGQFLDLQDGENEKICHLPCRLWENMIEVPRKMQVATYISQYSSHFIFITEFLILFSFLRLIKYIIVSAPTSEKKFIIFPDVNFLKYFIGTNIN